MKKVYLILAGIIGGVIGAAAGTAAAGKRFQKQRVQLCALSDKHLTLFLMMDQWVKIRQDGKSVALYLEEKGYNRIAVYGIGYAGQTLLSELRNTQVQVMYGIDQNADDICSELKIVSKEDVLEAVDAVVVTAITSFDAIKKELENKMDCPILSLEDIVYEM